ncbi:MAG: hypothetical protein JWL59_3000 [Chthoniobacteraceae bacterium]|nr:hypothetical protein [Chthoniobacteraceae bacterium]
MHYPIARLLPMEFASKEFTGRLRLTRIRPAVAARFPLRANPRIKSPASSDVAFALRHG